ncbi:MAG: hypothetical protein RR410_04595 [Alistipes sp.]
MKKLLISGVFVLLVISAYTQNYNSVRRMEYEVGIGVNKAHKINEAVAKAGLQLYLETRMNIIDTPFDIGVQALFGSFDRKPDYALYEHTIRYRGTLVFLTDYNLRKWKRVQPFVGLGLGMSFVDDTHSRYEPDMSRRMEQTSYDRSFVFNPRIGVELFSHVRVTAEYKWMKKDYSYFGFNLGFVFGGGLRR